MKSTLALLLLLVVPFVGSAQEKKVASPAEVAKGTVNGANITINYGSPSVKDRAIWGALVPYEKIWRAGANDPTIFQTSKDILVQGQKLPAGKYSLFIIPEKDQATIIFNTDLEQRGTSKYDEKKDKLRVKVAPVPQAKTEKLAYQVNASGFALLWDTWKIPVAIK